MATKVKNLLKGLRYISQMFDEKEEEIQIGFPTDVKHVAHIGCDGPSANMPSWMNEFRSPSEITSGPLESIGQLSSKDTTNRNEISRSRRHYSTNLGSPVSSPTKRGFDGSKHSRRRRSKDGSMGSPARDSSGSSRHSRRQQKSNLGPEISNQDQPAIPKSSRRKKGSTEGGSTKSTRSSRSEGENSLTDNQFLDLGAVSESGNKEVAEDKK
ncbi:hypothetical protein L484_000123 [Morus notabilis]|uniref:CRIB domain-containing protein n=1 Tax=Morus notabilis TaxID=981085 RepID=W9RJ54_9ROSA|nr:hypothetical protein L484_011719 [Morus notabilis]EXC66588.1 hypothetical protein L484_000123 [Morus notabilis]